MRVGQARRRDENEAAIVKAFEQLGGVVMRLSQPGIPDLLIAFQGHLFLVEVKAPGEKLTPAQAHQRLLVPFDVVREVEDVRYVLFGDHRGSGGKLT